MESHGKTISIRNFVGPSWYPREREKLIRRSDYQKLSMECVDNVEQEDKKKKKIFDLSN